MECYTGNLLPSGEKDPFGHFVLLPLDEDACRVDIGGGVGGNQGDGPEVFLPGFPRQILPFQEITLINVPFGTGLFAFTDFSSEFIFGLPEFSQFGEALDIPSEVKGISRCGINIFIKGCGALKIPFREVTCRQFRGGLVYPDLSCSPGGQEHKHQNSDEISYAAAHHGWQSCKSNTIGQSSASL